MARGGERDGDREGWGIWGGVVVLSLIGFGIAWQFVEPAPPDRIVLATGERDGAYHAYGERIAAHLAGEGVEVELRATNGSVENVGLLADRAVDVAFAQGGTVGDPPPEALIGLASLYFEPVWLFARDGVEVEDLRDLAGRRVVAGPEGSGTRAVAELLLGANGLGAGDWTETTDVDDADAVFVVGGATSSRVDELVRRDGRGWTLVDLRRHAAYEARFRALRTVVLTEGMFDLSKNLPDRPVRLLAPTAQLLAHDGLHHAIVPLLVEACEGVFGAGGLFEEAAEFPSGAGLDVAIAPEAKQYFKNGRSFLFRVLPFWLAALLDRLKVLLLPLLTLLFPLVKVAPPLYRWRIRSKIYRWYAVLRDVEMRGLADDAEDERLRHTLAEVEQEIRDVRVPPSYMEELYNLRMHLERVRDRLVPGRIPR